jgi:hypothetical protein
VGFPERLTGMGMPRWDLWVLRHVAHTVMLRRLGASDRRRDYLEEHARPIVGGVSGEDGTTPEYPDLRRQDLSREGGAAPLPDLSQHDLDRIAGQRSRQDEALQGHKKPSLGSGSCAASTRSSAR